MWQVVFGIVLIAAWVLVLADWLGWIARNGAAGNLSIFGVMLSTLLVVFFGGLMLLMLCTELITLSRRLFLSPSGLVVEGPRSSGAGIDSINSANERRTL